MGCFAVCSPSKKSSPNKLKEEPPFGNLNIINPKVKLDDNDPPPKPIALNGGAPDSIPKLKKIDLEILNSIRERFILNTVISFDSLRALFNANDLQNSEQQFSVRIAHVDSIYNSFDSNSSPIFDRIKSISSVNAPYIVPYNFLAKNGPYVYLGMDTSLFKYTSTDIFMMEIITNEEVLQTAINGVFRALALLHNVDIVHGEITPDKLLHNENKFYLYDFALGTETKSQLYISSNENFIAPEVLNGNPPTKASDVWELGATLKFLAGKSNHSSQLNELIDKMMADNEKDRINITAAINHEWFTKSKKVLNQIQILVSKKVRRVYEQDKAVRNLVNILSQDELEFNGDEMRSLLQTLDIHNSGTISLLEYATYVQNNELLLNAPNSRNIIVNYNEILCSTMAILQFIKYEKLAELFGQLGKKSDTIKEDSVKKWLYEIKQKEYINNDENVKRFIRENQTKTKEDLSLTFIEFVKAAAYLEYIPNEKDLTNKTFH